MKLSPIQLRIMQTLSDGQRHSREELRLCVDEYANVGALYNHITKLRKLLNPVGQEIIVESFKRQPYYRHVRLIGR